MTDPTAIAKAFLAGASVESLRACNPGMDIEAALRAHFQVHDTTVLRSRLDSLVEAVEVLARQSDHVDLRFTELLDEARDG